MPTGSQQAVHKPGPQPGPHRPRRGSVPDALPVLPARRLPGGRLPGHRRRHRDPPPPAVPGVRPPLHHGRDREPHRGQALRRHRAVQPGQGAGRRPQGLPGPPGHRGRAGAARPAGRGGRPGLRRAPRSTRTRSAWPSSARCASSTRSPTCGSRPSTAASTPSRTSRPRSRCCAPNETCPPKWTCQGDDGPYAVLTLTRQPAPTCSSPSPLTTPAGREARYRSRRCSTGGTAEDD